MAFELEPGTGRSEQIDQLIVNHFDHLLTRLNALDDLLPERFGFYPLDEITDHLKIDIGIQQGQPDFTQGIADVGLRNLAQAAQVSERILQLAAQYIEHNLQPRVSDSNFNV